MYGTGTNRATIERFGTKHSSFEVVDRK